MSPDTTTITGEGSLVGRFVTIITPFFTLFSGWLAGLVAHAIPGVQLDRGQIVAFMVAVSTATLTAALKWLHGWQQHEQNVADGKVAPIASPQAPLSERLLPARVPAAPRPASPAGRSV
jgi:hypothetical protein